MPFTDDPTQPSDQWSSGDEARALLKVLVQFPRLFYENAIPGYRQEEGDQGEYRTECAKLLESNSGVITEEEVLMAARALIEFATLGYLLDKGTKNHLAMHRNQGEKN